MTPRTDTVEGESPLFLTLRRWVDILWLSLLATIVCLLLTPVLDSCATYVEKALERFPYSVQCVCTGVTIFAFLQALDYLAIIRVSHLRYILKYPPTPIAALIGIGLFIAAGLVRQESAISDPLTWQSSWTDTLAFAIPLGITVFLDLLRSSAPRFDRKREFRPLAMPEGSSGARFFAECPEILAKWIETEAPVTDTFQDFFQAYLPARRILRRLRGSASMSIGLLGEHGSGKTTVAKLTELFLTHEDEKNRKSRRANKPKVVLCWVSVWPLADGTAAEQILTSMIKSISAHADVLSVSSVPASYQKAVSEMKSWFKGIVQLLTPQKSPSEVLARIDKLVKAHDLRLVVFVEDIDRHKRDAVFLNEIRALVDTIHGMSHLAVVLACGPDSETMQVILRVCEHTEIIHNLAFDDVTNVIIAFRKWISAKYNDIDTSDPAERDKRFRIDTLLDMSYHLEGIRSGPIVDIAALLKTPRLLKTTLRLVRELSESLHGEIDLDVCIVAAAIRIATPEAYAFLVENIEKVRNYPLKTQAESPASGFPDEKQWAYDQGVLLEKHLRAALVDSPQSVAPVRNLISFLFGREEDTRYMRGFSQTFSNRAFTDYWVRFNSQEIPPDEVRDQAVLRELVKWKDDNSINVLPSKILEHFKLNYSRMRQTNLSYLGA